MGVAWSNRGFENKKPALRTSAASLPTLIADSRSRDQLALRGTVILVAVVQDIWLKLQVK
jgi:hypothetical protein